MFEVTNQPPPLEPYNPFASDTSLARGGGARAGRLGGGGPDGAGRDARQAGDGQARLRRQQILRRRLRTLDRYGHRVDEVEFHPAWHELLAIALRAGLHSSPWAEPKPGAHVARAAGFYLLMQIESGVCCPLAMTYGSVPTLRQAPEIAASVAAEDLRPRI